MGVGIYTHKVAVEVHVKYSFARKTMYDFYTERWRKNTNWHPGDSRI